MREVKNERTSRMYFGKIHDVIEMPNLIQVQKDSYDWFVKKGLKEVLTECSPIMDYSGKLILEFVDYHFNDETKYTIEEAKARNTTYATRLQVKVRLINRETGEVKEQEIFMGDFPVMTDYGTFIINGAERVIVSQLVRFIFRLGGVVSLIDAAGNHMAFIAVTHMAVGMPLDTSTLRLAGRRICDYLDTYLTTGIARLKTQKHTFSCFRLSQSQNLRRSVYKFNALHNSAPFMVLGCDERSTYRYKYDLDLLHKLVHWKYSFLRKKQAYYLSRL